MSPLFWAMYAYNGMEPTLQYEMQGNSIDQIGYTRGILH